MIMLATPVAVRSAIGNAATFNYDKMVVYNISADPVTGNISASVKLIVSTDAQQPQINGSLRVNVTGNQVDLEFPNLGFARSLALGASASTVTGWITTLQNNLETGLVSLALAFGVQSAGV